MPRVVRVSPRAAAALLAAVLVLVVYWVLPAEQRPGLLPSSSSAAPQTNGNSVPPRAGAVPPPELNTTLAELAVNFTRAYRKVDPSPPPLPVYDGPYLTPAQTARYSHLVRPQLDGVKAKYMFTTLTRNIASQLPDLLNAIAVVTTLVGAEHVSFSILEGPSEDSTPYILQNVLRPLLAHLGVPSSSVRITTDAPKIDWDKKNRIEELAKLRNQALQPVWRDVDSEYLSITPSNKRSTIGTNVAAVLFFNDVFLHAADFLEVLHQHMSTGGKHGTGITTAWDWMTRDPPYFYDVWVARTMTGDLFYPIDGNDWRPSTDILSTSPADRKAFDELRPFQAFSSWNALAVLNPNPLQRQHVRFRRGRNATKECVASECQTICSDYWRVGWGRIQVVPSVQLTYNRGVAVQVGQRIVDEQTALGWRDGVPPRHLDTRVEFSIFPPSTVRCHPWPEIHGLSANVWENRISSPPYVPYAWTEEEI